LSCSSSGAGAGSYNPYTDTIDIANFTSSNGELAAHELFHAYADQNGDEGSSDSNETQSYLFQLKYIKESVGFGTSDTILLS